jgi:hypothetical protein
MRVRTKYPRIIIEVDGGLVSNVYSAKKLDVLVIDHDNEEVGEDAVGPAFTTTPLRLMATDTKAKVKECDS